MNFDAAQSQRNYRSTLRWTEAIAGGAHELASRLSVSPARLQAWAGGGEEIPGDIYLALVDMIIGASDEDLARARRYRSPLSAGSATALFGPK